MVRSQLDTLLAVSPSARSADWCESLARIALTPPPDVAAAAAAASATTSYRSYSSHSARRRAAAAVVAGTSSSSSSQSKELILQLEALRQCALFQSEFPTLTHTLLDALTESATTTINCSSEGVRNRLIMAIGSLTLEASPDNKPSSSAQRASEWLLNMAQPHNQNLSLHLFAAALLCNIALHRAVFITPILPLVTAYSQFYTQNTSSGARTVSARMQRQSRRQIRTLRQPLKRLLASDTLNARRFVTIQTAFTKLGFEASSPAARSFRARTAAESSSPAAKRLKLMDKQAKDPMFRKLLEGLNKLSSSLELNLIAKCMKNVSDAQLPATDFSSSDTGLSKTSPVGLVRLLTLLQEQRELEADPRLADPRRRAAIAKDDAVRQAKAQLEVRCDKVLCDEMFLGAMRLLQEKLSKSYVATVVPEIRVVAFTDDKRIQARRTAFQRALNASHEHEKVLSRLLAQFGDETSDECVIQYVLAKLNPTRVALAVQVSFALDVAHSSSSSRHSTFVSCMISALIANAPLLSIFVSGAAHDLTQTLDQLERSIILKCDRKHIDSAELSTRRSAVLRALRDLLMAQRCDQSRATIVLQRLLLYASSLDKALRLPTIGILTNTLFGVGRFHDQIRCFAEQLLVELTTLTHNSELVKATEDDIPTSTSDSEPQSTNITSDNNDTNIDNNESPKHEESIKKSNEDIDTNMQKSDDNEDELKEHREMPRDSYDANDEALTENENALKKAAQAAAAIPSAEDDAESVEAHCLRRLNLFIALCIKEPIMLPKLFQVFAGSQAFVKQILHKQMLSLIRTLVSSSSSGSDGITACLTVLTSFPTGSDALALHMLHIVTEEGKRISEPVVAAARYAFKHCAKDDARFLIPVVCGMERLDLVQVLPQIVALPKQHMDKALTELIRHDAPLSPSELLVRLHLITPTAHNQPLLKKVCQATQFCLMNRGVFDEKVLGACLQQLVERSPVPVLSMRTLIQTLTAHPNLRDFGMSILQRLISKRIWEQAELWHGFIVACSKFRPHSFPLMLQLPRDRLAEVFKRQKDNSLKDELAKFVRNARIHVRSAILKLIDIDYYQRGNSNGGGGSGSNTQARRRSATTRGDRSRR